MMETWALIKTNSRVLAMNCIICLALSIGYIGDLITGRSPAMRVAALLGVIALHIIICAALFMRDKASLVFKYVSLVGFYTVYCAVIFSSARFFTYVYIFPVIVLYILYYDRRLMLITGIVTTALNFGKVAMQLLGGYTASDEVAQCIVQAVLVTVLSMSLYVITTHTININDDKISKVLKSQAILENNAAKLYEKIDVQLRESADILKTTDDMKELSEKMTVIAENSSATLVSGMSSVATLDMETSKVNDSIRTVSTEIDQLNMLVKDIIKIVKTIKGIASNTTILSLNASVEAVRAGEYSKGFSVVAEEVRNLASQSQNSIEQITDIMEEFTGNVRKILDQVNYLKEHNMNQNNAINVVKSSFEAIETENNSLAADIHIFDAELQSLFNSNRELSESTQKIMEIAGETAQA